MMKKLFSRNTRGGAPLGQHLLTSAYIARDVAHAAHVAEGDTVLEVGPGKGMLTRELLALGARVTAVEKDSEMVSFLKKEFEKEIADGSLTLVEVDVRDFLKTEKLSAPYKVVANIPYYITGELLRTFLTAQTQPTHISLLVQKEVAERVARDNKESVLSLSVKVFGDPEYVKTVKAGSFNPPPKVDSAILAIRNISRDRLGDISEEMFFGVVKQGFSQKRKTLLGNLKKEYSVSLLEQFWKAHDLDTRVRAEDVALDTWRALTKALSEA